MPYLSPYEKAAQCALSRAYAFLARMLAPNFCITLDLSELWIIFFWSVLNYASSLCPLVQVMATARGYFC